MNILDRINDLYYLPQINSLIFGFLGKSKTAIIIEEYWLQQEEISNNCDNCGCDISELEVKQYNGLCEYCYAEEYLNIEIYYCSDCNDKTYEYTNFNNTENGLFCNSCFQDRDEYGNLIDEDEDE